MDYLDPIENKEPFLHSDRDMNKAYAVGFIMGVLAAALFFMI